MHKGDTIPGAVVTAFGITFLISTLANPRLTIGSVTSDGVPGAGFFPFIMSTLLTVLGIALMLTGFRQKGKVSYIKLTPEIKKNLKVLLFVVMGLIGFFIFWQLTKWFYPGALLLSIFLNRLFERSWKYTLIYSTVFTAFIYLTFSLAFSIQFSI